MASSNIAHLHYFNGKGKAEILRLVMAATGVEWEQKTITKPDEILALRNADKLELGNIPLVEYENKRLVHSDSISRFFAKRGGLLGTSEDDMIHVDIIFEGTRDFREIFGHYGFNGWQEVLNYAKERSLPNYLPIYEKLLEKNGSNGYLVGNSLTLADLGLLEVVLTIEDYIGLEPLSSYPQLEKFLQTMKSIDSISKYLNGPQVPPKINQEYIDTVKQVLSVMNT